MRCFWLASAHVLVLAFAPAAHAQRALDLTAPISLAEELASPVPITPSRPDIAFDATFGTSLPLSVGFEGRLETFFGLTAHIAVGHVPAPYMGMVAAILQGAGAYPTNVGPAVAQAIGNGAWNFRIGIGAILFDGLELDAGYTLIAGSSGLDPSAIMSATGQPAPWGEVQVPLSMTLHALHLRAGWRWVVSDHLVLRVGLGWTHALASDVHLLVPDAFRAMATSVEEGVRGAIGKYGFTPEILIAAGYRF